MSKRGPDNNHLIEESPERLALLRDILPGINANKGTRNCVHCALQVDEYLKAGENLGLGPVPKEKSDLLTYPIFKKGKIIRSTSEDPGLMQRTTKPSPYRMICNLNDDTPVFQLELTDDDSACDPSEARFRKATIENLKEQLIDLPRSSVDGSRYGFILLTRKEDDTIGHLMNFLVDDDDVVYLIDAQQPKEKQLIRNSEFQKMMKGFLPEIFFMQSIPPEGFALKKEERPIKVEEEIEAIEEIIDDHPKDKQKQSIIRALAEGSLLEGVELDGESVKLVLKRKYNNPAHYVSINKALYKLYGTSTAFQAKFKRPKESKTIPCLTLKSNHDYTDDKAVQDALMSFVSFKEKLHVREAFMTGSLLERVVLDGESVKLVLKRKYNNPAHYHSINRALYYLHKTSTAFQANFEKPKLDNNIPCLKLKSNHGYANNQAVEDALKNFLSSKEKLNVKEALAEGSLLEGVEFNGDSVRLLLTEECNHPDYYIPINQALYGLYKTSPDFQAKFEEPKKGNSALCLKLKPNHGYTEGQAVQVALVGFAASKNEKLNVKEALIEGSLLEHVELEDESVKLILKEKFNNPAHYFSINRALYYLHKTSTAFQAKFEQPKMGNSAPCLKLKSNHGYADSQSVQDALISFALSREKLSVKGDLAKGSLLEGVELEDESVKLVLKGKYNNPSNYVSINKALYTLHKASAAFQAKFEQPKQGNSAPCLKLKPDHGYAEGQSVQNALISFAASKERLNVKAALVKGSLLERVELEGDKIRLILKEKYNHSDYYVSINHALYNLHTMSPAFRDKFEQPRAGKRAPCLELKPNHGYVEGQAVQDALISFVSPKEKLNIREALMAGSLLERVELDGENVKLILKEKYNHPAHYLSISKAFYFLHKTSTAFQSKFEQPKGGNSTPCLKLKPDHGYVDAQAVQDALKSFGLSKRARTKETLVEVDSGEERTRVFLPGFKTVAKPTPTIFQNFEMKNKLTL